MKKRTLLFASVFAVSMGLSFIASAEETTLEKVETATNKGVDKVKKQSRKASDQACETVNGKMQCAGKKMKHSMQNGADAVGTKVKEVEKKTD